MADLTQLETSARADIAHLRYWRIENGYTTPESTEEARLARVFKLSVAAFREAIHSASAEEVAR